tara:strand:- start:72 stop:311 length:240 start_codon:yes stop_codon:yes gene_type:complete
MPPIGDLLVMLAQGFLFDPLTPFFLTQLMLFGERFLIDFAFAYAVGTLHVKLSDVIGTPPTLSDQQLPAAFTPPTLVHH